MKYFDIDESIRHHSFAELVEKRGFPKKLSNLEKLAVLEEQLRPLCLQPILYMDLSGFEILPAFKKFLRKEGGYKGSISRRAMEYINYVSGK